MTDNFQKIIFDELKKYFEPISELDNADDVLAFFNWMGWDIDTVFDGNVQGFVNNVLEIKNSITVLEKEPQNFQELSEAISDVQTLFVLIRDLPNSFPQSFNVQLKPELLKDLFEKLTLKYLAEKSALNFKILELIGVIYKEEIQYYVNNTVDNIVVRTTGNLPRLSFSKLYQFLANSKQHISTTYWPDANAFQTLENTINTAHRLFTPIADILSTIGFHTWVGKGSVEDDNANILDPDYEEIENIADSLDSLFSFYKIITNNDGIASEIGATLGLLSSQSPDNGPGIFIVPFGDLNITEQLENVTITLKANVGNNGLIWKANDVSYIESTSQANFYAILTIVPTSTTFPVFRIGSTTGTHLQIGSYQFKGFAEAEGNKHDAGIEIELRDAYFKISGGDGDGLLNNMLPDNGLIIPFNFTVGYSKQKGLYFGGSGGLKTKIVLNKTIGPIEIKSIDIGLWVDNGKIKTTIGAALGFSLGPIQGVINDVGLKSDIGLLDIGGNLGPLDLSLGFKSPSGLGLRLDGSLISGGAFINYDEASGQYSGMIELKLVDKVTIKGLAILDTKFPDGSKGYSLLIIISAGDFTPIQLGLGFTLNAIGGIVGFNRTMNVDELRAGVKTNSIDDFFLPGNIIQNAPRIINSVSKFFPVANNRFIIGPLARIGWGTPSIITLDVGLIIEMPKPLRIAMPGVLRAILPNQEAPSLKLQVNFLGFVDFEKKYLSFDASLFDSQLLTFTLTGDMALRLKWGNNPFFLLSVGGFHPSYTPPPLNLPALRRLSVQAFDTSLLNLRFETYFAITSNSVQFGSHAYLYFNFGLGDVRGYAGFDVLFRFSPFRFEANLGIAVSVRLLKADVLGAYLQVALTGPGPWRAKGVAKLNVSLVFFETTWEYSFNETFGEGSADNELENIAIIQLVESAISNKDNWEIVLPNSSHQLVTTKPVERSVPLRLVEPNGQIKFSQTLMPIGIGISKFGHYKPSDINKVLISGIKIGDTTLSTSQFAHAHEFFPTSNYFEMSEADKLDAAKAFQKYRSGFIVGGGTQLPVQATYVNNKTIVHEEAIITAKTKISGGVLEPLPIAEFNNQISFSSAAQSSFSTSYTKKPMGNIATAIAKEYKYYVAFNNNHSNANSGITYSNPREAELALKEIERNTPAMRGKLMVNHLIQ